jgi:TRAP-type C4-dicarboxylate transport system substrate-binding protein
MLTAGLAAYAAPTQPPKPKPMTLTVVAFLPPANMSVRNVLVFKEKVEQRSVGELIIDYKGGPEAIPMFEQPGAVRAGAIDIAFTTHGYSVGYAKEFTYACSSVYNPAEERQKGIHKIWEKLYKRHLNSFYLGAFHGGDKDEMYFFTNQAIKTPQDFAGLKLRSSPMYFPWTDALKIKVVSLAVNEVYSAMERHVVDGFSLPLTTGIITNWKLNEVTNYMIRPGFAHMDQCTLINLDKWNGLPKHLQNLLMDVGKELEIWAVSYGEKMWKAEMDELLKTKMKVIELSVADAEWWKKSWPAAYSENMKKTISPESFNELKVIHYR